MSNPSHVLSADNILGVRIQPQFLSDFMETLISKKDKIFIAGHLGMAGNAILRAFKKKGYEK